MISSGNWVRAYNLGERAAALSGLAGGATGEGDRQLAAWRAETPFAEPPWLAKRLAQDGLSEETFSSLAGLSESVLRERMGAAPFAEELLAAFGRHRGKEPCELRAGAFSALIDPLIRDAAGRLQDGAAALASRFPAAPFDPADSARLLWPGVADRLDWSLSRTVVLELHLAKLRGELEGATPAERFDHFVARLSEPERALAFFAEYGVLARCMVETLDSWVLTSLELLERLARDWSAIAAAFGPEASGAEPVPQRLARVSGGEGDLHCGGRAVRVLQFDSGFRVVYKPRSIEIHENFADFLDWLNRRGAPGLETGRVLSRPDYGWLEFVAARECRDTAEVERFYRRQGAFLAIFYVLNATDFHRENLIARGDHPIFIDLECLLTPDYGLFDPRSHDSLAHFEMHASVMRVMLLPFFHESSRHVYDPSGLGGEGGQESVNEVAVWKNRGTDEMRLNKERPPLEASHNRPRVDGAAANPLTHREALQEGFASTYRLLMRHRGELLAADSVLARFGGAEVRIVLRASQFYAFILEESYHPDLLRDALDRDRHFDRLWYGIDRTRFADLSLKILPLERKDLWRGDIPLFSALAGSRDLRSGGGELLPELLGRSGLEMARERLASLSEADLERQLWYLNASLAALTIQHEKGGLSPFRPALGAAHGVRQQALEAAAAVARRLGELAMVDGEQAAFTGLAQTRSRGWWLRPLDTDLYSGLPGVALFLAHSGEILQRPEDIRLARRVLANLDRQLERRKGVATVGAFDGWGGLVYTWLSLARLWDEPALVEKARAVLPRIRETLERDEDLDVVRGSAGGIPPLLALHAQTGDDSALELARRMGDRLLAKASPLSLGGAAEDAIYWKTASFPAHPLTGLSHGNSGFAWALAQLSAAAGDGRYLEAARRALLFEEYFFSARHRNWMDLRPVTAGLGSVNYAEHSVYSVSWCHGAMGIGLARLRLMPYLGREEMLRDAEVAAATVAAEGFGVCHCLCHGDLGNLDLLAELARQPGQAKWAEKHRELAERTLQGFAERGLLCGVPYYVETPGLMDGLAGIGYGLLRLAEPERVPSVLLLELPGHR